MKITAAEMRKIAEQAIAEQAANVDEVKIDRFTAVINSEIVVRARRGDRRIAPFTYLATLRMPGPNGAEREAILHHYLHHGFTWEPAYDDSPKKRSGDLYW